jgi:hypothetical protein
MPNGRAGVVRKDMWRTAVEEEWRSCGDRRMVGSVVEDVGRTTFPTQLPTAEKSTVALGCIRASEARKRVFHLSTASTTISILIISYTGNKLSGGKPFNASVRDYL